MNMKCKFEHVACDGNVIRYKLGDFIVDLCRWHHKVHLSEIKPMIPQPYFYKKGQQLWYVFVDDETGKCEMMEYIVKTIRRPFVYAIHKSIGITWVKKSKKHYDYGWAYPIPHWYRDKCIYGKKFSTLFTTKRLAWLAVIKDNKKIEHQYLSEKAIEKSNKTAKRMITKIDNKKRKK